MMRKTWIGFGLALVAGLALAASRKVERDHVAIMSGPGSFYQKVGELKQGSEADVTSEKGAWVEVNDLMGLPLLLRSVGSGLPTGAFEEWMERRCHEVRRHGGGAREAADEPVAPESPPVA